MAKKEMALYEGSEALKKEVITAEELREFLRNKQIICDCGHKRTQHNFSNTIIINTDGKVECFSCGY